MVSLLYRCMLRCSWLVLHTLPVSEVLKAFAGQIYEARHLANFLETIATV